MSENRQHGIPYYLPAGAEPGAAQRMEEIPFERGKAKDGTKNERWVQELIHLHPELLPIAEIESAYQPVIPVCMELRTTRGFIDNVFITPNGNLIFAETKLYRNPEARREVVAQVMDYAESLTGWTFEAFQQAAGKNLFELVAGETELNEERFIDAVARNLRIGRGLFLIVGDGIREETETLARHVQAHAGLQFALALVELACFSLPDGGGQVIHPRTIVRTTNIERGVVRVEDGRAVVSAPVERSEKSSSGAKAKARSLSAEEFYEQLAEIDPALPTRLGAFAERLEEFGVKAAEPFKLIWRTPDGSPVNLGYLSKDGKFWVSSTVEQTEKLGKREYAEKYAQKLMIMGHGKLLVDENGVKNYNKSMGIITGLLEHESNWIDAIKELISALVSQPED